MGKRTQRPGSSSWPRGIHHRDTETQSGTETFKSCLRLPLCLCASVVNTLARMPLHAALVRPDSIYPLGIVRRIAVLALLALASGANAGELQWNGFALLRGASADDTGPLRHDELSAQVQLGLDWWASPTFGAHVHLLGRSNSDGRRATAGIPEAYLEWNLHPGDDRLRLRGGAFFLPTSRENVDALWENPYAITSSALNGWLGEELRPIGIDASYFRKRGFVGATVFRGNDTLGALPAVRGWTLDDHWTLLGEWIPVDDEYFTSVSAETDHRLGWAARGGWNGERLLVQLTHFDNRSDGREYGELFNWGTRFNMVSAEYTVNDWTFAAENGWGATFLVVEHAGRFTDDIQAGYALVSRRFPRSRATARFDSFRVDEDRDHAVTLAWFWTGIPRLRLGAEVSATKDSQRVLVEVRYLFSGR